MLIPIFLTIISLILVIGFVYSRNKAGPRRSYDIFLNGKVAIITGSSAGIGKETARKFASRGATVIFACRNKEKTQPIIEEMKKQTSNKELHFMHLDLPDYESVRQFVKEFKSQFKQCDYLINNAGIFLIKEQKNQLQHELTFATNHLGHFLLTNLLLDCMSEKSRIINIASGAHEFKRQIPNFEQAINGQIGTGMNAYATSKFANIVFTQGLQQKLDEQKRNIKVVSVHPGFVRSEIYHGKHGENPILVLIARSVIWLMSQFSLDEEQGARTTEYTAFQSYEYLVPGGYYEKNQLSKSSKLVRECGLEQQLWDLSAKAVKL